MAINVVQLGEHHALQLHFTPELGLVRTRRTDLTMQVITVRAPLILA